MRPLVRIFCFFLLMSSFGSAAAYAGWMENGVPVTLQWSPANQGAAVSDGSSGAIIAYRVCRNGVDCIAIQRVDSLGAVLWGQEEVLSYTASEDPRIISDGAGGAIVTWADSRGGSNDIYAQRVNTLGAVQWIANGIALCAAEENQGSPKITSDGAGGAIVVWEDLRRGDTPDIYVQRIDASGVVQWMVDGVSIVLGKSNPQITSDGAGGAIVTWEDNGMRICAQRIDASGAIQWTWAMGGVELCVGNATVQSTITADGGGGAIVAYSTYYGIYAQRVNASGIVQWAGNGVAICAAPGDAVSPMIASDSAGGAVVTWCDYRTGGGDIYAQRVDTSGVVQWTVNGVALCTATGDQTNPAIATDGAGGAIVTWRDARIYYPLAIYTQRVDASGTVQWTGDGVALSPATGGECGPQIISAGAGGAIVTWSDYRSLNPDIYAQRVNASGEFHWTSDGVALCVATGKQNFPAIMSDGAGGAIMAWAESRNGNYDIYAQRISATGAALWTTRGVALCTETGEQYLPTIASDHMGGAIVAWVDYRNNVWDADIYAQRVNASGVVQWTANGVALCTDGWNQTNPIITSEIQGGAIVAWIDNRDSFLDIYAQRVSASGTVQWTADGVRLCTQAGEQSSPAIVTDGGGGAIVVWQDLRNGSFYNIYAQRVIASGVRTWGAYGVALCTATGSQSNPKITTDGAGGAIVAWTDSRNVYPGIYNNDIYAQRVNATGALQWGAGGAPLCTVMGDQLNPAIAPAGVGGAIVAWEDGRGTSRDIYAQRVNASGAVQWSADCVALCTAAEFQGSPTIASDGQSGAIVAWWDGRRYGNYDVYAQRVNGLGAVQWAADGAALCTVRGTGDPSTLGIASDVAGGALVVWDDYRCKAQIYAQRISGSGGFQATLLQHYSTAFEGSSIRIAWTLSERDEGTRFAIYRASAPDYEYAQVDGAEIVEDGLTCAFTDARCLPGTVYKYRIEYEIEGTAPRILFETSEIALPSIPMTLYQNHPNPFNPQTTIRFYLPEAQEIFLDVYDVRGERVVRLAEGMQKKGYHEVTWDGRNGSGAVCSSGVYFGRLRAGKYTASRKMVIMR
jgi:hypothetical protein